MKNFKKGGISLSSAADPVTIDLAIVQLLAIDPLTANVTQMLNSFQDVITCCRGSNETLLQFAICFNARASKHLLRAHTSPSSQVGKLFAITLLNNAQLDESTLTNAKSDLINRAKHRKAQALELISQKLLGYKDLEATSVVKNSLNVLQDQITSDEEMGSCTPRVISKDLLQKLWMSSILQYNCSCAIQRIISQQMSFFGQETCRTYFWKIKMRFR